MNMETTYFSALAERYVAELALPREFYDAPEILEHDIRHYWNRNWIWVGHESMIPEAGDFFRFDYGPESVIILRDQRHDIRAHINVCRHRGSRVCLEQSGRTKAFVCPYHAWTYDLEGRLRGRRAMAADFRPGDYGLKPAQLLNFQGLLFICLDARPPEIGDALMRLEPLVRPFGLARMKIAHQMSYPVAANWKLALENYLECYHCAPAHKEYSLSHSLKDPASMTPELMAALAERSRLAGLPDITLNETGKARTGHGCDLYYRRYPLYAGYLSGSKSGAPLAPLLGDLREFDGGATDIMIGPLNNFLAYSDHVVGYRFVPRGVQEADIQLVWMVHEDAQEGRDYDLQELTWLWHVTTLHDERIIRHNQAGVNSFSFTPGPLSQMEQGLQDFYCSYLEFALPDAAATGDRTSRERGG